MQSSRGPPHPFPFKDFFQDLIFDKAMSDYPIIPVKHDVWRLAMRYYAHWIPFWKATDPDVRHAHIKWRPRKYCPIQEGQWPFRGANSLADSNKGANRRM
jgi:hypothetical protein